MDHSSPQAQTKDWRIHRPRHGNLCGQGRNRKRDQDEGREEAKAAASVVRIQEAEILAGGRSALCRRDNSSARNVKEWPHMGSILT
jgi:hypothetical protein